MKKKDLVLVVISSVVLVVASYFLLKMMFPKKSVQDTTNQAEQKQTFTGKIDEQTYGQIKDFKDYGEAPLDGISRNNPFAPL